MVAIYQDNDAESALEALKDMQATNCQVLREGKWTELESKELVPGDIVKVNTGMCVPADIRITEMNSISLFVEEAPLTGESVSVEKQVEEVHRGSEDIVQAQKNMLFSSTIISNG
jgi:Ca2+-transporting ATPase